MPYSSTNGKQFISSCIELIEHKTLSSFRILDLGAGSGTYSNLYRSKLKGNWTAIEAWEPYVDKFDLTSKYDNVIVSKAEEFLATAASGSYDIIFLGDMLEHLELAEAKLLLESLTRVLSNDIHWQGIAFVSVPIGEYPQDEYEGNPYEAHLATWERKDLEELRITSGCTLTHYQGEIGVAVLGSLPLSFSSYSIAKNEAKFITRMIDSVTRAGFDTKVLCDTGSTDETVQLVKNKGVHLQEIAILPWRFDTAKNVALNAIPLSSDYVLSIDCDEVVVNTDLTVLREAILKYTADTGFLPDAINHSFSTHWNWESNGTNVSNHYHERVHRRTGAYWIHPVHEKLKWQAQPRAAWCTGFKLLQQPDLSKSRASYLPLLRIAVKEDPHDWKLQAFLADEANEFNESKRALETALTLENCDQSFISLKLGFLYERYGQMIEAGEQFVTATTKNGCREMHVHLAEFQERRGLDSTDSWSKARAAMTETFGYHRREDCWNNTITKLIK